MLDTKVRSDIRLYSKSKFVGVKDMFIDMNGD